MKKIFFTLSALLLFMVAFSQPISKITISNNGNMESIGFEVETNVMLNISAYGHILNWGWDVYKDRGGENYTGELQNYVGRVEYYTINDNEAFRGKIRTIGRTTLTYYASYEGDEFIGKIKSIGNNNIQYYFNYDNEAFKGKIKSIGSHSVTWNASYTNEGSRGKLKSLGSTQFEYFNASDDKAFKGKIKSINGFAYSYYSSFDRQEYRGSMKTGMQLQFINGIKYFVKN